jgi:hypothetical protein
MRILIGGLLVLASLVPLGCGPGTGTVSGTVKSAGRPLGAGHITFISESGKVISGPITDGSYRLAEVPVGPAKIAVKSFAVGPKIINPLEAGAGEKKAVDPTPAKTAEFVKIDPHYGDPDQSKLTYTVQAGQQTHDIELK